MDCGQLLSFAESMERIECEKDQKLGNQQPRKPSSDAGSNDSDTNIFLLQPYKKKSSTELFDDLNEDDVGEVQCDTHGYDDVYLCVVTTLHACCAQLLVPMSRDPDKVNSIPESDATTSTSEMKLLWASSFSTLYRERCCDVAESNKSELVLDGDKFNDCREEKSQDKASQKTLVKEHITCAQLLESPLNDNMDSNIRGLDCVLVLGTNQNHVYSIEMTIAKQKLPKTTNETPQLPFVWAIHTNEQPCNPFSNKNNLILEMTKMPVPYEALPLYHDIQSMHQQQRKKQKHKKKDESSTLTEEKEEIEDSFFLDQSSDADSDDDEENLEDCENLLSQQQTNPFSPQGGVTDIVFYNQTSSNANITDQPLVWISYGDGTAVRLSLVRFFPSTNQHVAYIKHGINAKGDTLSSSSGSDDDEDQEVQSENSNTVDNSSNKDVLRAHLLFNYFPPLFPNALNSDDPDENIVSQEHPVIRVLPLPNPSSVSLLNDCHHNPIENKNGKIHNSENNFPLVQAMTYTTTTDNDPSSTAMMPAYQVYSSFADADSNTNKNNLSNGGLSSYLDEDTSIADSLIGGTKALARYAMGMWGSSNSKITDVPNIENINENHLSDRNLLNPLSPPACKRRNNDVKEVQKQHSSIIEKKSNITSSATIVPLPGRLNFIDPPRRITSMSVDPTCTMVATCDTLGRISLIDLEAGGQTVRMWKGLRDATCHWITLPRSMDDYQEPSSNIEMEDDHSKRKIISNHVLSMNRVRMVSFLVIHARQRRVVEVWRTRHGPRVKAIQSVGKGVKLIQCRGLGDVTRCFIVRPSITVTGGEVSRIEEINIANLPSSRLATNSVENDLSFSGSVTGDGTGVVDGTVASESSDGTRNRKYATGKNNKSGTLHLQMLKQILSSDSSIMQRSTPEDVYDILEQMTSLVDLGVALDVLGKSTHLEEEMGAEGSTFHSHVLELCQFRLEEARPHDASDDGSSSMISSVSSGDCVKTNKFEEKLVIHERIVAAYDVLHRYESASYSDDEEDDIEEETDNEINDLSERTAPRTPWAVEAMAWIDTYEKVSGCSVDANLRLTPDQRRSMNRKGLGLSFSTFFKACMPKEIAPNHYGDHRKHDADALYIFLTDSTRSRIPILEHIFSPLLKDIFVFKVVNSVFDCLGIREEYAVLQKYFGEWFMTLPANAAAKASLFGLWCPILRWLQEMITSILDEEDKKRTNDVMSDLALSSSEKKVDNTRSLLSGDARLDTLRTFCEKAADLPRAFLLAAVCREAVLIATRQKEAKSYGMVLCREAVEPWNVLLRKIRVCLLVDLRLRKVLIEPLPITVANVEEGGIFSIFSWIARDELMVSHQQNEIVALEDACRSSRQAFHPSCSFGDAASKYKLLQDFCMESALKTISHTTSKRTNNRKEDRGPLLLYLSPFNCPLELAAHRALILSAEWGETPASLHLLEDAVRAMCALDDTLCEGSNLDVKSRSISNVVCSEIFQTRIRPVYRALLFGFDDVDELSEDIMYPLCHDPEWVRGLGKIASEVMALMERSCSDIVIKSNLMKKSGDDTNNDVESLAPKNDAWINPNLDSIGAWPVVKDDPVIKNLISRSKKIEASALAQHRSIICALLLHFDVELLSPSIPHFNTVFLQDSMSFEVNVSPSYLEHRTKFLKCIISKKARNTDQQILDHITYGEINVLCGSWDISVCDVKSMFLLEMYRLEKDALVDEFVSTCSTNSINVVTFISGGLDIACVRFTILLETFERTKKLRSIIGLLDADTCEWVKDRARKVLLDEQEREFYDKIYSESSSNQIPSLLGIQQLLTKFLQMGTSLQLKTSIERARAISKMSTVLLQAIEDS